MNLHRAKECIRPGSLFLSSDVKGGPFFYTTGLYSRGKEQKRESKKRDQQKQVFFEVPEYVLKGCTPTQRI